MQLGDCSLWQDMLHLMLFVSTDLTKFGSPDQKACHEHARGPLGCTFLLLQIFCLPNESKDCAAGQ